MTTERLSETLIEIDGTVRVEQCRCTKTGIASSGLLDDSVTGSHYQHNEHLVGKMVFNERTGLMDPSKEALDDPTMPKDASGATLVYRDAIGKPIFYGEEMTYRDWVGEPVWGVYQLTDDIWVKVAEYETETEATVEATKLGMK